MANHLLPCWQPNGFLAGEMSFREWYAMDRFQRYCWIWCFKNRYMSATGDMYPERYLRLRFEDLVSTSEGDRTIEFLGCFLGLPEISAQSDYRLQHLNQSAASDHDPIASLSDTQCRDVARICGRQMREYGYGNEPAWRERLRSL